MTYTYTNTNKWTNFNATTESGKVVAVPAGGALHLDEKLVGGHPEIMGDFAPATKAKTFMKKGKKSS